MNSARQRLQQWFAAQPQGRRYVVAASGGVDSTLVAMAALRYAPGDPDQARSRVLALTADTPFVPSWEKQAIKPLFQSLGIPHDFVHLDLLADQDLADNPPDRCYRCKKAVMGALALSAGQETDGQKRLLLDGSNADDDPARPGLRALAEMGVRSPLRESGITKNDVRALARELGLPNAEKPSESCLATRISGPINWERLNLVEGLEKVVRKLGVTDCRVRYDDLTITIETSKEDSLLLDNFRSSIMTAINDLGLPGYRWRERRGGSHGT